MIRAWVIGKDEFECDGREIQKTIYPDFLPRHGSRGTSVIILYNSENCDHLWIDETYFHKGQTFHTTTTLDTEQVDKYARLQLKEMWRD